jgi:hypothetical protein
MRRVIGSWLVLAGLWLAMDDTLHLDDLLAGAAAATAGTVVALVASSRMSPDARLPRGAWGVVPRVAWRMVLDSGLLLRALWQTVALRRPVRGRWVSAPIDDADTPEARGHRIFAVLVGSLTPNRVVGDAEGGRVVVHQLVDADEPLDPLAQR